MAFEQRELSGSIFKNEKKSMANHPNATGSCLIDGVEYWISAWTKDGAKGKWQSLSFTRKDKVVPKQETPKPRGPSGFDDLQDDVPF